MLPNVWLRRFAFKVSTFIPVVKNEPSELTIKCAKCSGAHQSLSEKCADRAAYIKIKQKSRLVRRRQPDFNNSPLSHNCSSN